MGWASRTRRQEQGPNTGNYRAARASRRPKQDLRLSERLVDLIAPYRAGDLTRERYEALIGAAATAWNLSISPEPERLEALKQALRDAKTSDVQAHSDLILELMRRKEALFPDDDRTIVHWEVSESGEQYHLSVMSAV